MADDTAPTDRPTGVRAGGTLDLSTGRPAPPPPPAPAPRLPRTPDPDVRVGKALDLSRGTGAPRKRRASDTLGHGPVVRETVDLTTHTPAPAAPSNRQASPARNAPPTPAASRSKPPPRQPRGVAPKAASSSLADLLDPEVLARLRGDG